MLGRERLRWFLCAIIAISSLAIGGGLYAMRYPSEADVDAAFARYAATSGADGAETLNTLFRNLRGPNTNAQGDVFFYALHKLEGEYLGNHDEMLADVAVGALSGSACCEIANGFCGMYERLLHDPVFFAYFRANVQMREALRSCNGANFSAAEVDALVSGEVANMNEFDARFRVRAAKIANESGVIERKD